MYIQCILFQCKSNYSSYSKNLWFPFCGIRKCLCDRWKRNKLKLDIWDHIQCRMPDWVGMEQLRFSWWTSRNYMWWKRKLDSSYCDLSTYFSWHSSVFLRESGMEWVFGMKYCFLNNLNLTFSFFLIEKKTLFSWIFPSSGCCGKIF